MAFFRYLCLNILMFCASLILYILWVTTKSGDRNFKHVKYIHLMQLLLCLEEKFRLCSKFDGNNENDVINLFESLVGNFEGIVQYNKDNRAFEAELQRRSSKVLEKRSLKSLLKVGNLYQASTTLGLEPVSIVHYTRPGSSIKRPTPN